MSLSSMIANRTAPEFGQVLADRLTAVKGMAGRVSTEHGTPGRAYKQAADTLEAYSQAIADGKAPAADRTVKNAARIADTAYDADLGQSLARRG